jgi:hypothetical protein
VIVARRLRIESYGPAQNLSNCAVWIDSYGKVPSGLFVYSEGVISPSNLPNAPSTGPEFSDADVVDGSFECNIVSLNVSNDNYYYLVTNLKAGRVPGMRFQDQPYYRYRFQMLPILASLVWIQGLSLS